MRKTIIVVVVIFVFVVLADGARSLCAVQVVPLLRLSVEHSQTSLSDSGLISGVVRLVGRPVVVPQRCDDVLGAALLLLLLVWRQLPDERTDAGQLNASAG